MPSPNEMAAEVLATWTAGSYEHYRGNLSIAVLIGDTVQGLRQAIAAAIAEARREQREIDADLAAGHRPRRARGGYADGLIEGDPMRDIADLILKGR